VALSGGADSVALAWLLQALGPEFGGRLCGLIHVNHHLRGADSDADEAFCVALAARVGVPIEVVHVDVAAARDAHDASPESAARIARYRAFEVAAANLNATAVATGHTLDDQAETVVMRLLRGAGPRGLSGVRVRRGRYIRPLLDVDRSALRQYLNARSEPWREDASNLDMGIARNRLRHDVMPALTQFAPGGVRALARLATLAADDEAYLTAASEAARKVVARPASKLDGVDVVVLDAAAMRQLAPAVARRLVRAVIAELAPGRPPTARHLEAVWRLAAADKPVGHLDLPRLAVDRSGSQVTLRALPDGGRSEVPASAGWPPRAFPVPGRLLVPEASLVLIAREAAREDAAVGEAMAGDRATVVLGASSVRLPLAVRSRRPGDRFRPLAGGGRRSPGAPAGPGRRSSTAAGPGPAPGGSRRRSARRGRWRCRRR
jgi:tRNA(Ile)-lysidine synthase